MNSVILELMISYCGKQRSVYHAQGKRDIALFLSRQQSILIAQRSPEKVAELEHVMGLT